MTTETEIQFCEDCAECKLFKVSVGATLPEDAKRLAECKAYPDDTTVYRSDRNFKFCEIVRNFIETGPTCSKFKAKE